MAGDLTVTAADVAAVSVIEQDTAPANEAVNAGQAVAYVAASGKAALADSNGAAPLNSPKGIAIKTANVAGITITFVKKGVLDLGDALDGLNFNDPVYLSRTPGMLSDVDPGETILLGRVVPGWGATTADKLLRIDL